jgi:beta-carotene hydroxylase
MMGAIDLDQLDDRELLALERQIARRYIGRLSWFMVFWPVANLTCWLSLWVLVFTNTLPLIYAFPIAVLNCNLAYLPSHDAQHDIYGRPGEPTRWLNQLIGHLSVLPLAASYRALRETHLEHHRHANNPELDPDYPQNSGETVWQALYSIYMSMQPGSPSQKAYLDCLSRLNTDEARRAIRDQISIMLMHYGILFVLAMNGYALEGLLLWWLPLKTGLFYNRFYLSWMPHFPNPKRGRYRDTHGFKSWLGNISSLGMTAHLVHHLHPRIPLDRTPQALRELAPILEKRGVDLG